VFGHYSRFAPRGSRLRLRPAPVRFNRLLSALVSARAARPSLNP
jgi:hypothetical protein